MNKAIPIIFTSLTLMNISNLKINKENQKDIYEIYPNVQNIEYLNTNLKLSNKVNFIFDDSLDIYTKDKAYEVFSLKEVRCGTFSSYEDNMVNLILTTYENKNLVNSYVKTDIKFIEDKIDAYYLKIDQHNITIVGKNTDAVYYGLSTLNLIFKQTDNTIRNLEIKDYASSIYRGFIEGYYGIPWTSEERKELMNFASNFKANIYIYAPKDDAYHSTSWRDLYNQNDLEILKEQIEVGRKSKVELAWAIHPFMSNKISENNYEASLNTIKNKFNQLYDAGVRSFVVSADDVEVSSGLLEDGSLHNKLLNDLATFLKSKEGAKDLVFVPSAYCYQAETRLKVDLNKYYKTLMNNLDSSIHIMWTGDDVCSTMKNGKFDEFKNLTNKKPFFWLNWPVNDYSTNHLLMGKAEILNVNYDEDVAFEGMVTNPMQQAEASKIGIFAICDYAWNTKKFNINKSYNDSFKYIENDEYEALKTICSFLTNATPYEGQYFEESPELENLIINYKQTNSLEEIYKYLLNVASQIDNFNNKAANTKLKDIISPWVDALNDGVNAGIDYIKLIKDFDSLSNDEMKTLLDEANLKYDNSLKHENPVLNVITYNIDYKYADYGMRVLKPFLESISQDANDKVKLHLGLPTGIIYSGFDSIYEGDVNNMMDGDDSTYCWFGSKPSQNAFIRIDLEEVKDIHDIRVLFGNKNGATDYLVGNLYYSLDAINYTLLGSMSSADVLFDLRDNPIKARYLKLQNTNTETWVSIKEIKLNTLDMNEITYSQNGFVYGSATEHTDLNLMGDNDLTTYVWFDWKCKVGAYVLLDLRKVQQINKINFYQNSSDHPGDVFQDCTFYISSDNINYEKVGDDNYLSQDEIIITLTSKQARYIKVVSNIENPTGICIREFTIE